MRWRKIILAVAAALVIAVAVGLPVRARRQRVQCINSLGQVNEPLNCCVPLEKRMKVGDAIDEKDLLNFFRGGVLPKCPSGADFVIPFVAGGRPVCPIHGDLLASVPGVKVFGTNPIYFLQAKR